MIIQIVASVSESKTKNPVSKSSHPQELNKFIGWNLIYAKDRIERKTGRKASEEEEAGQNLPSGDQENLEEIE